MHGCLIYVSMYNESYAQQNQNTKSQKTKNTKSTKNKIKKHKNTKAQKTQKKPHKKPKKQNHNNKKKKGFSIKNLLHPSLDRFLGWIFLLFSCSWWYIYIYIYIYIIFTKSRFNAVFSLISDIFPCFGSIPLFQ